MEIDVTRTALNVRQATTPELLCRVTVERDGMEPEAIALAELELEQRGVTDGERSAFVARHGDCLRDHLGLPLRCSQCELPAQEEHWGWHRLWGKIPVFPRKFRRCRDHLPAT